MRIIGIDCATQGTKTGLALGFLSDAGLELRKATLCRDRGPVETIKSWFEEDERGALLAIDAPLGWPKPLGDELVEHVAGAPIKTPADDLFRRATDRFVQRTIGKTPLDVGADRIARTAHTALGLLESLRELMKLPIPLAWHASDPSEQLCAIEVYPAATLVVTGAPHSTGYKKAGQVEERRAIVKHLQARMHIGQCVPDLAGSADLLDAAICVLAGADFLSRRVMYPPDLQLAQREGWIWVAPPETTVKSSASSSDPWHQRRSVSLRQGDLGLRPPSFSCTPAVTNINGRCTTCCHGASSLPARRLMASTCLRS